MPKEPKERIQFNTRLDGRRDLIDAVDEYLTVHNMRKGDFVAKCLELGLEVGVAPSQPTDAQVEGIAETLEKLGDAYNETVPDLKHRIWLLELTTRNLTAQLKKLNPGT